MKQTNLKLLLSMNLIFGLIGCGGGGSSSSIIDDNSDYTFGNQKLKGIWYAYYNTYNNGTIIKDKMNDIWEFSNSSKIYAIPTNNEYSRVDKKTLAGTYDFISNNKIKLNGENGTATIDYVSQDDTAGNCIYVNETFDGERMLEIWCKQNDFSNTNLLNESIIGDWEEYTYKADGTLENEPLRTWSFNKNGDVTAFYPYTHSYIHYYWYPKNNNIEISSMIYEPIEYFSKEGKSIKVKWTSKKDNSTGYIVLVKK